MAVPEQHKLHTADEFERFIALPENAERRFQLIHGEIVEMSPSERHGMIAANITTALTMYVRQHRLGRVAVEPRHRASEDAYNVRLPDVAFTSAERALPVVEHGAVPQMPDLAIEIKSPDDTYKQMRETAAYYLANGARMVWLVYPEQRLVEVYHADADIQILTENDAIEGGALLPGFILPVVEVFAE
jgi:Uma2 family endonuclease